MNTWEEKRKEGLQKCTGPSRQNIRGLGPNLYRPPPFFHFAPTLHNPSSQLPAIISLKLANTPSPESSNVFTSTPSNILTYTPNQPSQNPQTHRPMIKNLKKTHIQPKHIRRPLKPLHPPIKPQRINNNTTPTLGTKLMIHAFRVEAEILEVLPAAEPCYV